MMANSVSRRCVCVGRPGSIVARCVMSMIVVSLISVCANAAMVTSASASGSGVRKPFGIKSFSLTPIEGTVETGTSEPNDIFGKAKFVNEPYAAPFTQAGAHPWGLTARIEFNTEEVYFPGDEETFPVPTQDPKDVVTSLPPGLLGDPMAVPRCSLTYVASSSEQCPGDTQVGWYAARLQGGKELVAPVVDVAPEAGQSAEFALENTSKFDTPILTGHLVRTCLHPVAGRECEGGEGYGFTVVSKDIPILGFLSVELTLWGVPADSSHDEMRGRICRRPAPSDELRCEGGKERSGIAPVPFLTMPADCAAGPETVAVKADSWEEAGKYMEAHATLPAATGCDSLRFDPTLEVHPDTILADEPVGLEVGLKIPLSETPGTDATPQLRNTIVTFPDGMSISPGAVDGIQACEEFGSHGIDITGPESEEAGLDGELQLAPGHCPNASIVGTAEAITPFLPIPVYGHVYLARPNCGAPGEVACREEDAADGQLYRLYLELGGTGELAQTGVHFKVPLETEANLATGQLTTRALETPQAPFSELKIHLNGGPRAPIANPATCGPAVTTSDFTPWSAPGITPSGQLVAGTPDSTPSSFFDVEGCVNPPGLNPGFLAGNVSTQAAAFTPFTLNLSREDREQYVKGIVLHTPPGLLGLLASVPLCGEAQANVGTCEAGSQIGTTRVASGAGSHPFEIEGSVFLTGPYNGAPFGLSIVTHVVAGPFNLGVVVVRARIAVNQETSTLTIATDETGPHAIPQIVFGVPLRLRRVTVDVNRPDFMFNPTNCSEHKIEATITGTQGASTEVKTPFTASDCSGLAFKPNFSVSTSGHTSRANGANLDAKLSYPSGSLGKDTNIASVKVDLPKQLPSRLSTLQKACPAARFEANPATCPPASVVGIVRAKTPLLPVGLSGPVYFVSHGGEAFPSLIVVLQGDGVRVDLTGTTFISKAGITSSTFKTVPDVPVDTFELYLPEGKTSALAANGNLCKSQSKLKMPTEFVAQNGVVLKQTTRITVTGCAASKAKAATRHGRQTK
jgi:hypothetical protein